jgi:hypothetical protein
VSSKDSLPGVSLRYGISLADLRRANQLWPSDPIHLRSVLYIPLDKSHKGKELYLSHLESTSPRTSGVTSPVNADDKLTANDAETSLVIRRIPAAQLSFFPPPSSTSLHQLLDSSRTLPRSAVASRKRDAFPFDATTSNISAMSMTASLSISSAAAVAPTPPTISADSGSVRPHIPSLSNLFSSLPIGRISFDSSMSTPSAVSDDQEHELRDVSHRGSLDEGRDRRPDRPHTSSLRTSPGLEHSASQNAAVELHPYSQASTEPLPQTPGSGGLRPTQTTPSKRRLKQSAYVSPDRPSSILESIRTSQMEPSPVMQIPLKAKRDTINDSFGRIER